MYRYSNGQISLADFKQPVGMNLKESNRWVKKAQTIPWLEIEKRYAALFTNRKGNVAKPLRLALGACTRAQVVAFLWRAEGSDAAGTANSFADVPANAYYTDAVNWAVENSITGGTSATTFSPAVNCTRAQIVTFLYRDMVE